MYFTHEDAPPSAAVQARRAGAALTLPVVTEGQFREVKMGVLPLGRLAGGSSSECHWRLRPILVSCSGDTAI
jgi:hypothetical protein